MAQLDVFRLKSGILVVDLQTDLIGIVASRIVAPLRDAALPGLTPRVEIDGAAWIVRLQKLAAVPGAGYLDRRGLSCRSAEIFETAFHFFQ